MYNITLCFILLIDFKKYLISYNFNIIEIKLECDNLIFFFFLMQSHIFILFWAPKILNQALIMHISAFLPYHSKLKLQDGG